MVNQGSKAAKNVRVGVYLPSELKAIGAEAPMHFALDASRVVFDAMPELAPKSAVTFKVRAQGVRPGDLRVRCQLMTDDMQTPVTREESTRVYADE